MIETLLLVGISFAVGYMTRPRLAEWWGWNRPVRCWKCRHWFKSANTARATHRVAGSVRVCSECWKDLYKPFEGTK